MLPIDVARVGYAALGLLLYGQPVADVGPAAPLCSCWPALVLCSCSPHALLAHGAGVPTCGTSTKC